MHSRLCRGVCLGVSLLASAAARVDAQVTTPTSPATTTTPTSSLPGVIEAPPGTTATTAAGARRFAIETGLSVTETLTDNSRLFGGGRRADLITQVTPGIHVTSTGGRVRGNLDYSLTGLLYLRNSSHNELQNALNAAVVAEAVENRVFIDASANISQQLISAFGTRSSDSSSVNDNRTEVRTFNVSPYVRGRLGGFADYEARLAQTWSTNSSSDAGDNTSTLATLRVAGDTGARVNWAADASHQRYDFAESRRTYDDRVRGLVYVTVNPQLRLTLIEGYESNNIASFDRQGKSTPGAGLDWYPTERTRLSAQYEKRFFGNSHTYQFEHRTPRTIWRFIDTQGLSTGFGQPVLGRAGTVYDLYFTQFASIQPDPVARAVLVDAFLRANGLSPTAQVFAGSLASALTRQRTQELSFALIGIRDTVTFAASQTRGNRLDNTVVFADDFANGNVVRQRGFIAALSHRLTPSSGLNVVASLDRTSGDQTSQTSTLRSIAAYWNDQLNPRTTVSLGARHSRFSSPSDPYNETSVTAAIGIRF